MLDEAAELREMARRLAKAEQDRAEVEGRWEDFMQHAQVHSRDGRACQRIARREAIFAKSRTMLDKNRRQDVLDFKRLPRGCHHGAGLWTRERRHELHVREIDTRRRRNQNIHT